MNPVLLTVSLCVLMQGPETRPAPKDMVRAEQELALGQIAFQKKAYKKAIQHFNKALKHRRDWIRARRWRGLAYSLTGRNREAEEDLTAAVGENPQNVTLRKALARVQIAQSKFMWALRQLQAVAEMKPADLNVRLKMAYCLMRLEEYGDAREVLQKVLKAARSAGLKRKARFLLGLCQYRKDKFEKARVLLGGVGSGPGGPDPWRRGAREVLELLLTRQFGVTKGFGWTLSVGGGLDTNPAMNHEGDPGWTRTTDAAVDAYLAGRIWWTPLVKGRHSLGGELAVQRHFYVAAWDDETQDRVSAFNMTILEAGGIYRYGYLSGNRHRSLGVGYNFMLTQLDGGKGIPSEAEPFIFMEKHGMRLTHQWRHNPVHSTELLVRPWYVAYRDKDRDGAGFKASVRHSAFLFGRRFKLFPELWTGYQHTRWQAWQHAYVGGWIGVSWLAPWSLDVTGAVSYEFRHYMNSSEAFEGQVPNAWRLEPGMDRMDHVFNVSAGVGRALDKKKRWRLDLSVRYTYNLSGAELYRYSRLAVLFGVTAAMERTSRGWR